MDVEALATLLGEEVASLTPVSGGDVAKSYRVELARGSTIFAKTHAAPPANFFSTEAAGIEWLRAANAVRLPQVLAVSDDPAMLALAWVDEAPRGPVDEADFGRSLAKLHQAGAPGFGREDGRTTGSRGLPNQMCDTWYEFYATQRLLPLCKLARDATALSDRHIIAVEALAGRLDVVGGPPEPAARLHGDLWAGNRIVDEHGLSWLIDPACHGGHREFDLAMMRLFGGFSNEVFAAYAETHPLAEGWQGRIALHQLAPLMVHAIKFGASYVPSVQNAIAMYGY